MSLTAENILRRATRFVTTLKPSLVGTLGCGTATLARAFSATRATTIKDRRGMLAVCWFNDVLVRVGGEVGRAVG